MGNKGRHGRKAGLAGHDRAGEDRMGKKVRQGGQG
jgi:hypothetical protein